MVAKKPRRRCKNCELECSRPSKFFCNNKCQMAWQYKKFLEGWKNGLKSGVRGGVTISYYLRRYLLEKYYNKCCKCGWDRKHPKDGRPVLQVNHIDGDIKNNREDNLEVLCPNCHALTSTFGSRNKKSTRDYLHGRYKVQMPS